LPDGKSHNRECGTPARPLDSVKADAVRINVFARRRGGFIRIKNMIIKIILDRFENDKAVLKTEDGENIIWPKNKLPENAQESQIFNFTIDNDEKTAKDKKGLAKNILNEILDV